MMGVRWFSAVKGALAGVTRDRLRRPLTAWSTGGKVAAPWSSVRVSRRLAIDRSQSLGWIDERPRPASRGRSQLPASVHDGDALIADAVAHRTARTLGDVADQANTGGNGDRGALGALATLGHSYTSLRVTVTTAMHPAPVVTTQPVLGEFVWPTRHRSSAELETARATIRDNPLDR